MGNNSSPMVAAVVGMEAAAVPVQRLDINVWIT
jgi:hypothetical protein